MKRKCMLFITLMSIISINALAHDIEVVNADGKTIYYNYINDGQELEVTFLGSNESYYSNRYYKNVVIPEEVTYMGQTRRVTAIGKDAFHVCSAVTSVTIPNSVTTIGDQAFAYCTQLTTVTLSNNLTSIGNEAFSGCGLLSAVTIGNSVTSIGVAAFWGCCGLTSLFIPNSVTSIGDNAFSGCSGLISINVDEGNTVYDSRNGCNAIIEKSSNTLILGCKNTSIPNSVTSIGNNAFTNCLGLASIIIPNNVASIGIGAFSGCHSLMSATISNNVETIGNEAFADCVSMKSVSIGDGMKYIKDKSFYGCESMNNVYCHAEIPPSVETDAFQDFFIKYATLHVPATSVEQYKAHEVWGKFGTIAPLTDEEETSISMLSADETNVIEHIYTIDNKQTNDFQKGVNIIQYKDGTAKKVLAK